MGLSTGSVGRARRARAAALVAVAGVASTGQAHDEDWRKLMDRLSPVLGPIWTASATGDSIAPLAAEFDAQGVELLSVVPLNNFAGTHGSGNDCWGYVSPSGREYAIMGLERGFGFVEITDPLDPRVIETIPGPGSLWHDVKVIGQFAYGVSEGGSGIQVMDLSQIDQGTVTLVRNAQTGGHSTTHNIVANTDSGTLYLVGANIGNGGLINVDISDPADPRVTGGWTEMYVHDAQVVTYDSGPFAGREIAFCASGFDGGFTQTGLRIVDITNKSNPTTLATLFYPNAGYSHQVWLSEDRTKLYLNDELDEQNGRVSTTTTRVIDVTDLTSPSLVGTFTSGSQAVDHNLYVRDGYIFEANYRSGLRIFDGSDPINPVQVAYFDTFPGSDSDSFNGAWSVYPFFPSGTVIVSDIERGLFVLAPDVLADRLDIDLLGEAPEVLDPEGGQTLRVEIEQLNVALDPATVVMRLEDASGVRTIQGTAASEPGVFEFTTPTIACGEPARYWFTASSIDGEPFFGPLRGADDPFVAVVASSVETAFDDDFQADRGWTVSDQPGLSAGTWERGVPDDGGRGDPPSDFDGSGAAYLTENQAGNSDVDGGATTLTSPRLDASSPDSVVSYARWYSNSSGNAPQADVFRVQISGDDGATWQALETVGPDGPEVSGGWFERSFLVSDFVQPSDRVRIRFIAEDAGDGSIVEAAVDAVAVRTFLCEDAGPACPADLTGAGGSGVPDGTVDANDFFFYLGLFASGDGAADLSGPSGEPDGVIDANDFFAYLGLFSDGCG